MASSFNIRGLASRLANRSGVFSASTMPLQRPAFLLPSPSSTTSIMSKILSSVGKRWLSATPINLAEKGKASKGKKGKGKKGQSTTDPKVVNLIKQLATLSPPRIPPPLRMGRNRYLRHWTIHRAWMLWRRQERERREGTLKRQYQSMNAACEELRLTEGPGTRDQGYLYRVAMEKKGVWGHNGVPIEYARPQTETPARKAWNHEWVR